MDDILRGVTTNGTAARAHQVLKRNDVGGKTGTTNDAVDVWFSGFTPDLATTVWMGFDQPKSLGTNEFGSGLALSTWLDYMQPVLKGVPEVKQAPRPDGLLVDNGEYYFSEFPPGQAVASLDLSSGDELTDFLNNNLSTDGVDTSVKPLPAPGANVPPPSLNSPIQPPLQPIPVPSAGNALPAVPTAGGPAAGVAAAGVPAAGVPAAGVPAAGVPAAGVPVAAPLSGTDGGAASASAITPSSAVVARPL
ncbi:Penicillin-binding protein 1A [compost metagenome]